jgi:hypothetical protein
MKGTAHNALDTMGSLPAFHVTGWKEKGRREWTEGIKKLTA